MSSEEEKKQNMETCECSCTGWKVGFWLCFISCILVFVIMLILFIKKRKFQEKVLPIIQSRANKVIQKAKEKLDKANDKINESINKKLDLNQQYKDIKANYNNDDSLQMMNITPSSITDSSNTSSNGYIPLKNNVNIDDVQNTVSNNINEAQLDQTALEIVKDDYKTGGSLTSLPELGLY